MLKALRSLFKFCQGAAHVWDVHELGLARQERALQEKLDTCRHSHDNENQDREANLDIVMDRMRQDASEQALQNSLKKALDMLDQIKDGSVSPFLCSFTRRLLVHCTNFSSKIVCTAVYNFIKQCTKTSIWGWGLWVWTFGGIPMNALASN